MLAGFLLALAIDAHAAPEPPPTEESPAQEQPVESTRPHASGATWVSQPTRAQFMRAYPPQAEWNATSGRAVLDCVFTAAGRLSDCTETSEEPAGQKFGAAALKLAPFFWAVSVPAGASLEGKLITLPVSFDAREHLGSSRAVR
jgi:hypothetical protein